MNRKGLSMPRPRRNPQLHDNLGPWVETSTNRKFYLLNPTPEQINLADVVISLARQPRYTGHGGFHYSVAQHLVLVSRYCKDYPLEGLLHDIAETWIGDISRPLKQLLKTLLGPIEEKIEGVAAKKFGLVYPWPFEVENVDNWILAVEKRDLFGVKVDWDETFPKGLPDIRDVPCIEPWDEYRAGYHFMLRYLELSGAPVV